MPDSLRDSNFVGECLNLMSDVYCSPTFCIFYIKDKKYIEEFFTLTNRDECYSRIRYLRSRSDITCLSCHFYFDLEVSKI